MARQNPAPRSRLQSPRLAELVADVLRERILSGELPDGSMLPRQEDLMKEFRVSMPSLREAIRILESEGMITVLRGNVGGAIVHAAPVSTAAYTMAMVLQSRRVPLNDVARALRELEPVCAAMCARRRDRKSTVVRELRKIHKETLAARESIESVTIAARRFHEAIVEGCGSETMIMLVGALEQIWSSHSLEVGAATRRGEAPELEAFYDERALDQYAQAHEAILEAIAAGDAEAASARAAEHLAVIARATPMSDRVVQASVVRSGRVARGDGSSPQ